MVLLPFELLFILSLALDVHAQKLVNRTVDHSDQAIQYSQGWSVSSAVDSNNSGTTFHLSNQPLANATFQFTGVAIYLLTPLWPHSSTIRVTLDEHDPILVDVSDGNQAVASRIIWGMGTLDNTNHTLVMQAAGNQSRRAAIDALMYTAVDNTDIISDPPFPAMHLVDTFASSTTPTTTTSSVPIIIGASVGAGLGILGIALAILYWRFRRPILRRYGRAFGIFTDEERYRDGLLAPQFEVVNPGPTTSRGAMSEETSYHDEPGPTPPPKPITFLPARPPVSFTSKPPVRTTSLAPPRLPVSATSSFFPTPVDEHPLPLDKPLSRSSVSTIQVSVGMGEINVTRTPPPLPTVVVDPGSPVDDGITVVIHQTNSLPESAQNGSELRPSPDRTPIPSFHSGLTYYSTNLQKRLDVIVEVDTETARTSSVLRGRSRTHSNSSSVSEGFQRKTSNSRLRHEKFERKYLRRPHPPVGPRSPHVTYRASLHIRTSFTASSSSSSPLSQEIAALFPVPPSLSRPAEVNAARKLRLSMQTATTSHSPTSSMRASPSKSRVSIHFKRQISRPLPLPPKYRIPDPIIIKHENLRRAPLPALPTRGGVGSRSPPASAPIITDRRQVIIATSGRRSLPIPPSVVPMSPPAPKSRRNLPNVPVSPRKVVHTPNVGRKLPTGGTPSVLQQQKLKLNIPTTPRSGPRSPFSPKIPPPPPSPPPPVPKMSPQRRRKLGSGMPDAPISVDFSIDDV